MTGQGPSGIFFPLLLLLAYELESACTCKEDGKATLHVEDSSHCDMRARR
jgi:hypothetical protein